MGVASTEGGGLARRPSSEIDRLAAKGRGIWAVRSGGQYQQVRTRVGVASRLRAPEGHKTLSTIKIRILATASPQGLSLAFLLTPFTLRSLFFPGPTVGEVKDTQIKVMVTVS